MKNGFFKLTVLLVVIAGLGWFWSGYWKKILHSEAPPAQAIHPGGGFGGPIPVGAVAVEQKDLVVAIDAVGTLSASESADIRAEVAGAIKAVNFSEGQTVVRGAGLVEIDDSLIRAELMKAEAAYNVRKTAFNRSDKLKESGYMSRQDWEQSKGSLQEARADIESSRIRLDKTKVRAPFDGLAGLRDFSVGDYVQVGQLLTTLDAVDPMKVTFSVPEKNYADIRELQKVSLTVDAWPGESFEGQVYAVSPRIDRDTRNFDVRASIPNTDGRLRPGMFARVRIITAVREKALVIPEQAVVPKGDDSFVFVVRGDKAVLQKIEIGMRQPGSIEVVGGLSAGEPVVVTGLMTLQAGAQVKAMLP